MFCIYAYVGSGDKFEEKKITDNTCSNSNCIDRCPIYSLRVDEYSRSDVIMELDLLPGESRGYWSITLPTSGLNRLKLMERSTMKKPLFYLTLGRKSRSSTPPLLVRWDVV